MKILITESQYNLLIKDSETLKLLRIITSDKINLFVDRAIDHYAHNMCTDFPSEYTYAKNIILFAARDFYVHLYGRYPLNDDKINLICDIFEDKTMEYLKKVFRDTCL
jgi:hypothetical protein